MMIRAAYPPHWETLAQACKERDSWIYQHCGTKQHEIRTSKKGNLYFIYLHAAHIKEPSDGDEPVSLSALRCQINERIAEIQHLQHRKRHIARAYVELRGQHTHWKVRRALRMSLNRTTRLWEQVTEVQR